MMKSRYMIFRPKRMGQFRQLYVESVDFAMILFEHRAPENRMADQADHHVPMFSQGHFGGSEISELMPKRWFWLVTWIPRTSLRRIINMLSPGFKTTQPQTSRPSDNSWLIYPHSIATILKKESA